MEELILKGIMDSEDAMLAVKAGADTAVYLIMVEDN